MSDPDDPRSRLRHALRTSLHQITGYAELLEEDLEGAAHAGHREDLARIRHAARRALEALAAGDEPRQDAPGSSAHSGPVVQGEPGSALVSARVLVVDDDAENRDLLARWLAARGCQVEEAEDGRAALERVARGGLDLMLLDIVMPHVSGLDVLSGVREHSPETDLPIIMTTARDGSEDVVRALRLGANDYLTKPLDLPVVVARIETQLALRRQKQEVRRLADDLRRSSEFVRRLFGRYLSDEVVSDLLKTPEGARLGGEARRVTLLLSDLRDFTHVTEDLAPDRVLRLLNSYLATMADVILSQRGTIDEFVGDAILAIFGAPLARPDDARRALLCAVEMQTAMIELNRRNQEEGLPPLEMGIAVHTGEVIVGNIGSERRTKYGVVGSAVNHAGRLESFTVGGQVLVSDAALRDAGGDVALGTRVVVEAKGTRDPIVAYELRGVGARSVPDVSDDLVALPEALEADCQIVRGKAVQPESFRARVVELSSRGAVLALSRRVRLLSNLKLEIRRPGRGAVLVYGKVVRAAEDGSAGVRFASLPAGVLDWLREVLERARSG